MADAELKLYRNADFRGGLNDWADPYNLATNEAITATNCMLDNAGALVRRLGTTSYHVTPTTTWNAVAGVGIFRAYCDQAASATQLTKALIAKHEYVIRYGTDSTGVGTQLKASFSGGRMRCLQWGDSRIYITVSGSVSGTTDHPCCWGLAIGAGTTQRLIHEMGVRVSSGTAVGAEGAACTAGQTTVGWYRYAVTVTYGPDGSWGESLPIYSAPYNHTVNTKKYALGGLTSLTTYAASYGAYKRKIYRSLVQTTTGDAAIAPCYFLEEVSLTGTAISDYIDSEYTPDVTDPAPTAADTGDIPYDYCRILVVHNNHAWGVFAGPNVGKSDRVYYSNLNMPDEWPAANYIEVMGEITGLWSAPFGLMIFTKHTVYLMSGWGLADLSGSIQAIKGLPGCVGFDTVSQVTMNGTQVVVWASEDGIYGYDGQQLIILGRTADGVGQKIGGTWKNHITTANRALAISTAWKDYYLIAYCDDRETATTNSGVNNRILLYDIRYDAWFTLTGWNVGGWCVWNGMTDSDQLYFVDSTSHADSGAARGKIYRAFYGASESSDFDWQSGYLPLSGEATTKQYRKVYLEIDHDTLPIDMMLYLDRGLRTSTWHTFAAPVAGQEENCIPNSLETGLIGKRVSVRMYKSSTTAFKVFGYRVGYKLKGTGRI